MSIRHPPLYPRSLWFYHRGALRPQISPTPYVWEGLLLSEGVVNRGLAERDILTVVVDITEFSDGGEIIILIGVLEWRVKT